MLSDEKSPVVIISDFPVCVPRAIGRHRTEQRRTNTRDFCKKVFERDIEDISEQEMEDDFTKMKAKSEELSFEVSPLAEIMSILNCSKAKQDSIKKVRRFNRPVF